MRAGIPVVAQRTLRSMAASGLLLVAAGLLMVPTGAHAQEPANPSPQWEAFSIDELRERRADTGQPWLQFLRVPDLFAGVYEIESGGADTQTPHAADEVYYVVRGRATLVISGDRVTVEPGSVVYVAKEVDHRFEDVVEDLTVLVFFATPDGP